MITLIATMMAIFAAEMFFSRPELAGVMAGFVPHGDIVRDPHVLYLALGILGATVMPHNLYLHSSIVQTRKFGSSPADLREAIKMSTMDSNVALLLALFVNSAILILAAATFYKSGHHEIASIEGAFHMLTPVLGVSLAAPLFAIALLASGQNSTLTGTMAGQIVLEGFTSFRIAPWLRRIISRSIAIVPAILVIWIYGERGTAQLLIFSQVVLSIQLSFAVIPLIQFTSDKVKMGQFVNSTVTRIVGWTVAAVIAGLNAYLIYATIFPAAAPK